MANQVTYGFLNLQNLWDRRVTTVGVQQVAEAIDQSLAEHTRQVNAILALLAEPTTDRSRNYVQGGVRRLQPGTEYSRPYPTQGAASYDVGFPVQRGQDSLGMTYEASIRATVAEVNRQVSQMMEADARWMRDHLLAALMDNTSWSFNGDEQAAVTVQPMANSDTVQYQIVSGADAAATDNHYIAQTAAIADATNPYDDIYTELMEHPENGGDVIAFIPTGLVATTKALANFEAAPDPNIRRGADESEFVGRFGYRVPGSFLGYTDNVFVVEWRTLPANTILAVATQGERPLAMRQFPEAELQGFRRDAERADYPWYQQIYTRRAGFGGNNRVGAVLYQVNGGDTTYDIPTNYTTPMP